MRRSGPARPGRREPHGPVAATGATAGVVTTAALPALGLALVTPGTVEAATVPGADVSSLLAAVALGLAWLVVTRLALTAAAVLLARVPGFLGAAAGRVAVATSPAVLRSLVRIAAGAAVLTAPGPAAGTALADAGPSPAATTTATAASVRVLPADEVPVLDRVVRVAATPPAPTVRPPAHPARPEPATAQHPSRRTVVVRSGDTLWDIAERQLPPGHTAADVARAWPRWFAANRDVIGPDPGVIRPGEQLQAPPG